MGHYFGVALRLTAKSGKREKLQEELDRQIKKGDKLFNTSGKCGIIFTPARRCRSFRTSFSKASNGNDACVYIENGRQWIGDAYYALGNSKSFDMEEITKKINSFLRLLEVKEGQVLAYRFFEQGTWLDCIYIKNGRAVYDYAGNVTRATLGERYLEERMHHEIHVSDEMTFDFIKDGLSWNLNDFDQSLISVVKDCGAKVKPLARVHVDLMRLKLRVDKSNEFYIARIVAKSRKGRVIITAFVCLDNARRSVSLSFTHSHIRKSRRLFNSTCTPLFNKHRTPDQYKKDNKDFPYSLNKNKFISLVQEHFNDLDIKHENVKINLPEGCSLV